MTEWQEIASAPRDGTHFLACITVQNAKTLNMWEETHLIWCNDETGDIDDEAHQGWEVDDYTCWTVVPAPPDWIRNQVADRAAYLR